MLLLLFSVISAVEFYYATIVIIIKKNELIRKRKNLEFGLNIRLLLFTLSTCLLNVLNV